MNGDAEWLEPDGLGGYASATVSGRRTRRYHALLLAATTPPTGRFVLVNGFDAVAQTNSASYALSTQRYAEGIDSPDGPRNLESFSHDPWPRWVFRLNDETRIEQEIFVAAGRATVVVRWRLLGATGPVRLVVRPFLSGRDHHALHQENSAFNFKPRSRQGTLVWQPYAGLPSIVLRTSGEYRHEPLWYRNFLYSEEESRGLECHEDLAAPGTLSFSLVDGPAVMIFDAVLPGKTISRSDLAPATAADALAAVETRRRASFRSARARAADAYLVRRSSGETIIAGYPWFTDWGRDTFISLRGLCLAAGRRDDAEQMLLAWAGSVSEGMLPNRFNDEGGQPEYNAVDASLWYIVAAHDFLRARQAAGEAASVEVRQTLEQTIEAILAGYARGTRFGIRQDDDGLLAAGEPGVQLTWMDAKVGDWVVTPRIGKPVEVQCLWLNALWIGEQLLGRPSDALARGRAAFAARFWNEQRGCLFDVVDADHVSGKNDAVLRPNQIFSVGGLPLALLEGERARRVVDVVQDRLHTPLGLRTLAPGEPGYAAHYVGDLLQRDGSYHQGTVWPWLLGPFVEAWVRVRGGTRAAKQEAHRRFVVPLVDHLGEAGLGHVSEIADAEAPYTPRGCPFQAWSLGELLRIEHVILADAGLPTDDGAATAVGK